jgi:preprotein translocase subunit SecY
MLEGIQNTARIPELRRRLLFTFAMLAVYRVGVAIPTPGIDRQALHALFERLGGVIDLVNLFSGGALEQFSIFTLGIMPYISVSIILQLLTMVFPYLERLSKEGEAGRRKITQYTRYGTVVLALVQGLLISFGLEASRAAEGVPVVLEPGWRFRLLAALSLSAGTAFIMWLGEQITERGIGNGISLIIFAGIVTRLPSAIASSYQLVAAGELGVLTILFVVALMVAVVGFIIFVERGQRRIPVQYAKRVVGRKVYGGQGQHLPLRVNTAGVIPPIFASSILLFPATMAQFLPYSWAQTAAGYLTDTRLLYNVLYMGFIIFFCYFYTSIVLNSTDLAENMKKSGGYIPGIRPGQKTAEFIDRVLSRITLSGAIYLSVVSLLPTLLVRQFNVPFFFGGTALLIVVGVALDTVSQIETHMITRSYEGFMRRGRLRGRLGVIKR